MNEERLLLTLTEAEQEMLDALLLAGFAGLGYAGWRKARQAAVRAGV